MTEENESEGTVPTFTQESNPEIEGENQPPESEGESETGLENVKQKWQNADEPPEADAGGSQSPIDKIKDALRSSEPHNDLTEIESPWDPEAGGKIRVFRGIQKMTGIDNTEAWFDILIGLMEWADSQNGSSDSGGESEPDDEIETVAIE